MPEFDALTVAEAIAAPVGEMITVKGVVAGGIANQVGFYLIDETGVIAIKTDSSFIHFACFISSGNLLFIS